MKISVMGIDIDIGIVSISIYSYELFKAYNVDNITRFGKSGALYKEIFL